MKQLDPALKAMLAQAEAAVAAGQPELWELSAPEARAGFKMMTTMFDGQPVDVHAVANQTIPTPAGELPIRLYTPRPINDNEKLPVLTFFHGGGWTVGDLDTHDVLCRYLSLHADCLVVAVDYRMGPEHKFPAAVEDSWAATKWVSENAATFGGDATRIAVGGDSAGGNLSAVVAHQAKNDPLSLVFQMLIYPSVDAGTDYPSRTEYAQGYFLTKESMDWFFGNYVNGESDYTDPRVSPMMADDFSELPPALVITAGFDPLQDEGKAYAEKLRAAGVPTEYTHYESMIHGF
ncbi:MAG: alpha/beta hydrolase, partial [Methylococcales bacterium]|nr:alpha/beta hydrolase [Methylococcales bacterium]